MKSTGGAFKSRPNDRNIATQHIETLLGATCRVRLATMAWFDVECCWLKFETGQIFHATLRILHGVVVVWPGSCNNVAPGHAH